MKYLKKFNEIVNQDEVDLTITKSGGKIGVSNDKQKSELYIDGIPYYDPKWERILPEELTVIKGYDDKVENHKFTKGNVMLDSGMIQITYDNDEVGFPNTLEFDIYISKSIDIRLDVDITWGDLVACEFSIEGNKVNVIQHTSKNSKFDPSNTVFAFTKDSLDKIVNMFNKFDHVSITSNDLKFLDDKH